MLFEDVGALHAIANEVATPHTCSGDANSNRCLDWTTTYPTLVNTGDLYFWVQVASSGTSGADTYCFKLRGSATVDGSHDLNGTIVDLVTSPTFVQSGTFCQKTDQRNPGLWYQSVPTIAQNYRYWQGYVDITNNAANLDLTVYWGVALKQAFKAPCGPVQTESFIGYP